MVFQTFQYLFLLGLVCPCMDHSKPKRSCHNTVLAFVLTTLALLGGRGRDRVGRGWGILTFTWPHPSSVHLLGRNLHSSALHNHDTALRHQLLLAWNCLKYPNPFQTHHNNSILGALSFTLWKQSQFSIEHCLENLMLLDKTKALLKHWLVNLTRTMRVILHIKSTPWLLATKLASRAALWDYQDVPQCSKTEKPRTTTPASPQSTTHSKKQKTYRFVFESFQDQFSSCIPERESLSRQNQYLVTMTKPILGHHDDSEYQTKSL